MDLLLYLAHTKFLYDLVQTLLVESRNRARPCLQLFHSILKVASSKFLLDRIELVFERFPTVWPEEFDIQGVKVGLTNFTLTAKIEFALQKVTQLIPKVPVYHDAGSHSHH